MNVTRRDAQQRPSVERLFALPSEKRLNADEVCWESSLTDWEWINIWASLWSFETATHKP